MIAYTSEFASEQRQALAEQVQKFREQPIESMRDVAMTSADGIKSLKAPSAHLRIRVSNLRPYRRTRCGS